MSNSDDPTRNMGLQQRALWTQIQGQPPGFTWTWFAGRMKGSDDLGNTADLSTSAEGLTFAIVNYNGKKYSLNTTRPLVYTEFDNTKYDTPRDWLFGLFRIIKN